MCSDLHVIPCSSVNSRSRVRFSGKSKIQNNLLVKQKKKITLKTEFVLNVKHHTPGGWGKRIAIQIIFQHPRHVVSYRRLHSYIMFSGRRQGGYECIRRYRWKHGSPLLLLLLLPLPVQRGDRFLTAFRVRRPEGWVVVYWR